MLFVLVLAACASPVPPEKPVAFVPLREDCTASEAIPIALEDFASDPDLYIGKCVRTHGLIAFRSIFPDLHRLYTAYYLPANPIAVYGKNLDDLWGMRKFADVVGFAYSCEQLWTRAEMNADKETEEAKKRGSQDEYIPFIAGECHYHGGPLIYLSQISVDENSPTRLSGITAGRYGNLKPLHADVPQAAEIRGFLEPIFESMEKRDEATLRSRLQELGAGDAHNQAKDLLDPRKSPFSFLFGANVELNVHYFVLRQPATYTPNRYIAVGCVCKKNDCDGLWPIATADAGANPDWPFACISVERDEDYKSVNW